MMDYIIEEKSNRYIIYDKDKNKIDTIFKMSKYLYYVEGNYGWYWKEKKLAFISDREIRIPDRFICDSHSNLKLTDDISLCYYWKTEETARKRIESHKNYKKYSFIIHKIDIYEFVKKITENADISERIKKNYYKFEKLLLNKNLSQKNKCVLYLEKLNQYGIKI